MHTFWQRLNAIFFYALSVLGFLAFIAAGTTYFHKPEPRINLSLKKIMLCATPLFARASRDAGAAAARARNRHSRLARARARLITPVRLPPAARRRKIQGAGHDQAILSLQIDADLRSVFNWNVKQLFVYVTAEYETEANTLNQVVVWDQIISHPSQAWIRSSSVANKYSLTDQGYGLRANNVTLALNWNTVPSTGLLLLHHGHEKSQMHTFDVPDSYS
jgi:signal peptidase complex subunit 3